MWPWPPCNKKQLFLILSEGPSGEGLLLRGDRGQAVLGDPGRQGSCGLSCCALPGGPSILQKWSHSLLSLGKIKEWLRKAQGLRAGLQQGRASASPQAVAEEEAGPQRLHGRWLRRRRGLRTRGRALAGLHQEEAGHQRLHRRRRSLGVHMDSSTAQCAVAVAPRVRRAAPSVHSGVVPGRVVPSSSLTGCSQGVGGGCSQACWDWRPVLQGHVLEVEGLSFRSRGFSWNYLSAWRPVTQQVVQEPESLP